MSTLADIDKTIAKVCTGENKKSDAMLFMSPNNNWDQFLTPAPFTIALLGDLMILVAGDTDFSLEEKEPKGGFKFLKYPSSFRSSLLQLCNSGWSAFNEAHKSMAEINKSNGDVDYHVKKVVKILMKGTDAELNDLVPQSLNKIKEIADNSLLCATAIENRFVDVMELTAELLEACTNKQGINDEKRKETEIALKVAKTERECRNAEVKRTTDMLTKMEREVREAQQDFKEAMDTNLTAGTILALAAGEMLIEKVRDIGLPRVTRNLRKEKLSNEDESVQPDETQLKAEQSKYVIYKEVTTIYKHIQSLIEIATGQTGGESPVPDWKKISQGASTFILKSLEKSRDAVSKETACSDLCDIVLKLCDEAINGCNELGRLAKHITSDNRDTDISNVVRNISCLQRSAEKLYAEAIKSMGRNPLETKSPHLSKMPTKSESSSIVQSAAETARYKTELAKETLKDAKRRQEKVADELAVSNEKLTQVLKEMKELDLKTFDLNAIRDALVKGITALADVREQWGKLIRFFQELASLIKCCLCTSLADFVDEASYVKNKLTKGCKISDFIRDSIFELAAKASRNAYVIRSVTGAYVKISNDHIMDKIVGLGKLLTMKDKSDILRKREELHNGCEAAQIAIRRIIIEEKEEFNKMVDKRIDEICEMQKALPPIEPKREHEIEESISTIKFDDDEINDMI